MKETGIIRRIDDMGRIVIPKELRRPLGFKEGDPIQFWLADGALCLRRYYAEDDYREKIEDLMVALNDGIGVKNSVEVISKLKEAWELLNREEAPNEY